MCKSIASFALILFESRRTASHKFSAFAESFGNNILDTPAGVSILSEYSPIRHLASAAFPFSDTNKHMFMLSAYMDETGHSSDQKQKFVGMAGLIAPAAHWETFEAKWKAALKLPFIDLPYFHMTDFASRKKLFAGWSEVKRQKTLGKLFRVIESIYPLPFGVIVPMELYRQLSDKHKKWFEDPYHMCFQNIIAACTTFLDFKELPPDERMAMIFSDQVEFRHRALQFYEAVKNLGMVKTRALPPMFHDMREIVPLQAADIVAYEMYKEVERKLYRPTAAPRYGFQRLEKMSERNGFKPMFEFFDASRFAQYIRRYEETEKLIDELEREKKT